MIFYLTATGNSLYAAKRLSAEGERLVSIAREMKREDRSYSDSTIGVVCPIFGHDLPSLVREFIKGSSFDADYFYVVGTYGCNRADFAERAQSICETAGRSADYINTVLMVDNSLAEFDMAEQIEADPEKHVEEQLDAVRADIVSRRRFIQEVTDADRAHHREYLESGIRLEHLAEGELFHVTDDCTACGLCIRICPTGNIRFGAGADGNEPLTPENMKSMRAYHGRTQCIGCLACMHACPPRATRFAELEEVNPEARYCNPHIPLSEIIAANNALG